MEIEGAKPRDNKYVLWKNPKCDDGDEVRLQLGNVSNERRVVELFGLEDRKLLLKSKGFDRGEANLLAATARLIGRSNDRRDFVVMLQKDAEAWNSKLRRAHEDNAHCEGLNLHSARPLTDLSCHDRITGFDLALLNLAEPRLQHRPLCGAEMVDEQNAVQVV